MSPTFRLVFGGGACADKVAASAVESNAKLILFILAEPNIFREPIAILQQCRVNRDLADLYSEWCKPPIRHPSSPTPPTSLAISCKRTWRASRSLSSHMPPDWTVDSASA